MIFYINAIGQLFEHTCDNSLIDDFVPAPIGDWQWWDDDEAGARGDILVSY